jgi:hypothetical protein
MSSLEIFQNGTSLHPDRIGESVYQIGKKTADGEYDIVVFDGMSKKEAQARLAEIQPKPSKVQVAAKPEVKKKLSVKQVPKKSKDKKKSSRKR